MNAPEVMKQLEKLGTAQTKKTYLRHGCPEPFFGVRIGDMKPIIKKTMGNTPLAKDLFKTGNSDACYLAGLIANGAEMSRKDLDEWAKKAPWHMISEYTVAWVATEHPERWDVALKWIDSRDEKFASAGWCTLRSIVAFVDNKDLDLPAIEKLMDRVEKAIGKAPNRVRYSMNGFIIHVGGYIRTLSKKAIAVGKRIGEVKVDAGNTSCETPSAPEYIQKMIARGCLDRKRPIVKC